MAVPASSRIKWFAKLLHGAGLLGVLLMVLGSYGWLYRHTLRQKHDDQLRVTQLRRLLASEHLTFQTRSTLLAEAEDLEQRAASVRARVPRQAGETEFLRMVTRAAQDHHIAIRGYEPQGVQREATHSEMRIVLKCESDYAGLCNLLRVLDSTPRLVSVERMGIGVVGGRYLTELTLVLYFGIEREASGEVEADHV